MAAAAAAALLAACGSRSADRQNTTPSPSAGIETSGSRATEPTVLGISIPFIGDAAPGVNPEPRELVTVVRVIDLALARPSVGQYGAAEGPRYVAVQLSIHDLGPATYRGNPGQETSLISEITGGYIGQRVAAVTGLQPCTSNLTRAITLASGQTAHGCVFFKVAMTQRISAVQYETQGGTAQNIATWALDRSAVHG